MSKQNRRVPNDPEKPKPPLPTATGADTLKTQMPAGEVGVRNPPGVTLASDSGGTSKAEDTSRAAGYVADLTKPNAAPPGPPVEKSPENFAGQTGAATSPGQKPAKATPNTTPPPPPAPPSPPRRTRPASK